jgi:hypothetical protein
MMFTGKCTSFSTDIPYKSASIFSIAICPISRGF